MKRSGAPIGRGGPAGPSEPAFVSVGEAARAGGGGQWSARSYYGYLLRTVPPGRLAGAALRRLRRGVAGAVAGGIPLPEAARVMRAWGARRASDLPACLARPVAGPWAFASPAGARAAARLLERVLPAEAEAAVERAERVREGWIQVFGHWARLPRAERRVAVARPSWQAIDWEQDPLGPQRFDGGAIPPGADPKNPWVVGRQEEAVHLALGALLLEERAPAAAAELAHQALDRMVDLAEALQGIQWACPMEVALRGANQAIALRLLAGQGALRERGDALLSVLRSLWAHAAFVRANWEDEGAVPNNHLVSNLVGLAVLGALLPGPGAIRGAARAAGRRLEEQLFAQTLPDGMSFEGSVAYHRLALELFVLGHLAAQTEGRPLSAAAAERLERMFWAVRELRDGAGEAPQIGDCDSGRALPFRPREAREQAYLLPLGAALFGAAGLNVEGPSAELIWLLGEVGLRRVEGLGRGSPSRDGALPEAGIYLLRAPRMSCAVACGPNGTGGTGTHGHNDKLAIELCVDGQRVVVDPGSGVYTSDPALRNRLRGTAHHSTVRVDGREQQDFVEGRLFALPEQAFARCLLFESAPEAARFIGEHHGYRRLAAPVLHQRELRLDRGAARLDVTDHLLGRGRHHLELRYLIPHRALHLREALPEEQAAEGARWRYVVEIGDPVVALLFTELRPRREDTLHAVGYGALEPASIIVLEAKRRLPVVLRTRFVAALGGGRQGKGRG